MNWVSLTQRKPGGAERWVEINLALAFKIEPDKNTGGSIIHFVAPSGTGTHMEIVVEPPNKVAEMAKAASSKAP